MSDLYESGVVSYEQGDVPDTGGKKPRPKPNPQKTNKDPLDRYYTPAWVTNLLLDHLRLPAKTKAIWEPCCGQGHIVNVLVEKTNFMVFASDVDPDSVGENHDFLRGNPSDVFNTLRPGLDAGFRILKPTLTSSTLPG